MRPAKIKVIGKTYKVSYVVGEPLDDGNAGEMDPDKQTLTILDGQPLEKEQDTVLHEVIHALEEELSINMKEAVVRSLATGLLAVIKDNPGFFNYLRKKV